MARGLSVPSGRMSLQGDGLLCSASLPCCSLLWFSCTVLFTTCVFLKFYLFTLQPNISPSSPPSTPSHNPPPFHFPFEKQ